MPVPGDASAQIKQVTPTPGQPRLSTPWCEDMVLHYDGSHLLEGQLHLHLGLPTLQPRLSSASVSYTQDQALPRTVQGLPGTVGQGPFSSHRVCPSPPGLFWVILWGLRF